MVDATLPSIQCNNPWLRTRPLLQKWKTKGCNKLHQHYCSSNKLIKYTFATVVCGDTAGCRWSGNFQFNNGSTCFSEFVKSINLLKVVTGKCFAVSMYNAMNLRVEISWLLSQVVRSSTSEITFGLQKKVSQESTTRSDLPNEFYNSKEMCIQITLRVSADLNFCPFESSEQHIAIGDLG